MGTCYFTCLIGGFVADAYLGRFVTVIIGCTTQFLGMLLVTLTVAARSLRPSRCVEVDDGDATSLLGSCEEATWKQLAVLYVALYIIACGVGATKSSISSLGADQFESKAYKVVMGMQPKDQKHKQHEDAKEEGSRQKSITRYFNFFGIIVSMSAFLAVTILVYVQEESRALGYGISATLALLALLLLLSLGIPLVHRNPPSGSAFTCIAHVLVAAWNNRHLPLPEPQTKSFLSNQFLFLNKASLGVYSSDKTNALESPWRTCSFQKIADVKKIISLLPILATTVVFWTVTSQAMTFSIEQGDTLDRRLGSGFEIPPASFPLFLQVASLITLPLYDQVIIPLATRWRRNDYGVTTHERMGAGLLISILSMVFASLIERRRLHVAHSLNAKGESYERLPMSIFYLTPQFTLMGVGQALLYFGQIEFIYREAPNTMRGLSIGMCLSTISLGFFLSTGLVNCIDLWTKHGSNHGWLTNKLDDGRLDYFYLFLGVLSFWSFLVYLLCSHWYRHNQSISNDHDFNESHIVIC
ncbi:hypothetical protein KP509_1Z013000 [Ceratopteris richardii]|nr:hypothetical protein KP509_1Z013000 [Ceratopteris richardii]